MAGNMNIDLEKLDLAELKSLQKQVERAIMSFEEQQRKAAIDAAEVAAAQYGFSLAELTGHKVKKQRYIAAPKYKHPENPAKTWTGKGRRPAWFIEAMEKGMTPDDLAI